MGILLSEIFLVGISYIYAFRFWDRIFLQQYELVSFILICFSHSCFPVSVTGLRITHLDGSPGTDESWIVGFIHRILV